MFEWAMRLQCSHHFHYLVPHRRFSTSPYATRLLTASVAPRVDPVVWGRIASPLASEQVAEFERRGFTVLRKAVGRDTLQRVLAELRVISEGGQAQGSVPLERVIVREPGGSDIRSIFTIHLGDDSLADLCCNTDLISTAAAQLLADDVYIHQSRANLMSAAGGAAGFTWHSDFESWHAEDGMPQPRALTAMVMCDANTAVNGPLMVMPRSHKKYVRCAGEAPANHWETSLKYQTYGSPPNDIMAGLVSDDEADAIELITGSPGDVLLFDSNLLHASAGNMSWLPRRNLFIVFNAVSNSLLKPFHSQQQRPEHLAHRKHVPVVCKKADVKADMKEQHRELEEAPSNEVVHENSFMIRDLGDVEADGDYKRGGLGKWESRRYLTRKHGLGFSFHHTIMYEGQSSFQWYPNHIESVYISEGEGTIEIVGEGSPTNFKHLIGTGKLYKLQPGVLYVLRGQRHILSATSPGGMHCMCVFNPPAAGTEDHDKETGAYPVVDDNGVAHRSYGRDLVPLLFRPPQALANGSFQDLRIGDKARS